MNQINSPPQANAEVIVNENFATLSTLATYGQDPATTAGLVFGYYGGQGPFSASAITNGTVTLTASQTNYIVALRSNGVVSSSTATTNWDNLLLYARIGVAITGAASITSFADQRCGIGGVFSLFPFPIQSAVVPVSGTSRNVTPADQSAYLRFTNAAAKTATFDVASSFASGQEYHLANRAATETLTLVETGVTLNLPKGGSLVLSPGDTVTVKFISGTEADVMGSTEPPP